MTSLQHRKPRRTLFAPRFESGFVVGVLIEEPRAALELVGGVPVAVRW